MVSPLHYHLLSAPDDVERYTSVCACVHVWFVFFLFFFFWFNSSLDLCFQEHRGVRVTDHRALTLLLGFSPSD